MNRALAGLRERIEAIDRASWIAGALPVALYLAAAGFRLGLPGLYDDEAVVGYYALKILRALRSGDLLALPTGIHYYHGILDSWVALPFLCLWPGTPTAALRGAYVTLGAVSVAGFYALVLGLFRSRALAVLTASLLAASPTFIVAARFGAYFGGALILFQVAAAAAFFAWTRRGRDEYFFILMALLGLGLNSRMQFVFVLAAYAPPIAAQFLFLQSRRPPGERWKVLSKGLLITAALAAPLLLHLAAHRGPLLAFIRSRAAGSQGRLWVPLDPRRQFARFYGLADGRGLWDLVAPRVLFGPDGGGRRFSDYEFVGDPFFPLIFAASAIGSAVFAVADARKGESRKVGEAAFILLWQAAFFCATALVSIANLPFHALAWLPFPQLTVALFVARCLERGAPGRRRAVILAAAAATATAASFDAAALSGFYRYAEQTGGRDRYTEEIAPLTRWLAAREEPRPVALTWGMDFDLGYLSGLSLETIPAHIPGAFRPPFDPGRTFELVAHAYARPGEEAVASGVFALMRAENRSCVLTKTFQDRSGLPAFRVWECGPRPPNRRPTKT